MIGSHPRWQTIGFVLPVVLYVANWATVYGLPQGLLGHAWSLAIEEQFHIFSPPLWSLLHVVRPSWLLLLLMTSVVALAGPIATLVPSSPCGTVLRCPSLRWIGRCSYALYLWHHPVFCFAGPLWQPGVAPPQTALLAWAVSFALAAASFRYIEQRALSLRVGLSQLSARLVPAVVNP